jgi:hypothetical protein
MRGMRFVFVAAALVTVALPLDLRASVLLATINDSEVGGFRDTDNNHQLQRVSIKYFYHSPFPEICVGCELVPTGFTGTTDYTQANAPDFSSFVSHLTNGVDETIDAFNTYHPAGPGGASGKTESQWFGLPSDLQGNTIDFIRRVIFTNTLTPEPGDSQFFLYNVDVSWEVWGTGPAVSPIPEPNTLTLLSVGIGLTWFATVMLRRRPFQAIS